MPAVPLPPEDRRFPHANERTDRTRSFDSLDPAADYLFPSSALARTLSLFQGSGKHARPRLRRSAGPPDRYPILFSHSGWHRLSTLFPARSHGKSPSSCTLIGPPMMINVSRSSSKGNVSARYKCGNPGEYPFSRKRSSNRPGVSKATCWRQWQRIVCPQFTRASLCSARI